MTRRPFKKDIVNSIVQAQVGFTFPVKIAEHILQVLYNQGALSEKAFEPPLLKGWVCPKCWAAFPINSEGMHESSIGGGMCNIKLVPFIQTEPVEELKE